MDFQCVKDCSQCCIEREYYPTKQCGKVGVLILPEEKERVEALAKKNELKIIILPRIGISYDENKPTNVLAYQMMGREKSGNTCPFLDTESDKRSPHGGFTCKIYQDRPLACAAFPVIESSPIILDQKCKFCQEFGNTADKNLDSEVESLLKIKLKMTTDAPVIWRYATGIGEESDKEQIKSGWIRET